MPGQSDVVSWVILGDHYKADVLTHKGFWLVELGNASKYHWVAVEVVETPSILNTVDDVTKTLHHNWQSPRLVNSLSRPREEDMQLFWGLFGSYVWMSCLHVRGTLALLWFWGGLYVLFEGCPFTFSSQSYDFHEGVSTMCRVLIFESILEAFLRPFFISHTSQGNTRDQGLISFRPQKSWFSYFSTDGGNILERFILVKLVTSKAHLSFCLSLIPM